MKKYFVELRESTKCCDFIVPGQTFFMLGILLEKYESLFWKNIVISFFIFISTLLPLIIEKVISLLQDLP